MFQYLPVFTCIHIPISKCIHLYLPIGVLEFKVMDVHTVMLWLSPLTDHQINIGRISSSWLRLYLVYLIR